MTAISVSAPFPILTDIDGSPLDAGYVYIGQANLDPVAFPKSAYWDASLTTPAAQPIRTTGGYPVRNGSPARIYTDGDYSIRINNKNGTLVYGSPAATDRMDSAFVGYMPAGTGAVATTVQDRLRKMVRSIEDFGAVASTDQSTAATNVAAIRAAITASAIDKTSIEVPKRPAPFLVNDNFTITAAHSGLHLFGAGTLKFANALNPANVNSSWMFNLSDSVSSISNVKIEGITLDGNRDAVKLSGVTPATSFGVWVAPKTLLGDGVEISNVTANNFVTSGFQIIQGPITLKFPCANANGMHGIGIQNDPDNTTLFMGWASIISPRTGNCEGYGIDFAGGKVFCSNHIDDGSWYGNAKAASGLEHLILRGAVWVNSPGNPADAASGRGFLTTGTAASFANTTLDIDGVYIEKPKTAGFNIGTFDGKVILGSIIVKDANASIINADGADINIAASSFTSRHLASYNSKANGILITDACKFYVVDYAESIGASRAGFVVKFNTGACDGVVKSAVMRNNNKAGLTGASAAPIQHLVAGNVKISNAILEDTQATPTQVSGMYFAGGAKVEVNDSHFGSGITANQQVYSATTGTRVRFGRNNTGIVTYARGVHTANGGGTNLSVTFPTAMTALGGAVYYAQMTPASSDASGAHYISATSGTALTLLYTSATPVGTNNVSYRYDVEMEVQR